MGILDNCFTKDGDFDIDGYCLAMEDLGKEWVNKDIPGFVKKMVLANKYNYINRTKVGMYARCMKSLMEEVSLEMDRKTLTGKEAGIKLHKESQRLKEEMFN